MQSFTTTESIQNLAILLAGLEANSERLTDEEHDIVMPIVKAATPLLDALHDAIDEMCRQEDEADDEAEDLFGPEDWS